jgi:ferric-dicitrate binding protein FerR (iron transport regulator)
MTTRRRSGYPTPRDSRARERLREAQQQETQAVASVCAAVQSLDKACAKRDAALSVAAALVEQAQESVTAAQAALVGVSGFDRAAALLGMPPRDLRRNVGRGRRATAGVRSRTLNRQVGYE